MRRGWRMVRPHLVSLALVVVSVAVVVASGVLLPRVVESVADARLRDALADAAVANVVLSAELDGVALDGGTVDDVAATMEQYPAAVEDPLGPALVAPEWLVAFPDTTVSDADGTLLRLRLGMAPELQERWELVRGAVPIAWVPGAPLEVALEQSVADRVGASVGTMWTSDLGAIVVAAIVAGDDSGPAAQAVFHRAAAGVSDVVVTAGAYVDPGSVGALGEALARAQFTGRFGVDPGTLASADAEALGRAANRAAAQGTSLPSGYPVTVSSRVGALVQGVVAQQNAFVALAALLASAPLGAAALVAALAVGAAERRRSTERRLRSARGASLGRVAAGAVRAAAVAAAIGAAAGWVIALALTPDATSAAPLVPAAAVLAAAFIAAVVAASAVSPVSPPRVAQALAGAVLVAVAAGATVLLVVRGVPDGGVDPLVSAVPLLVALAASAIASAGLGFALPVASHRLARGRRLGPSLALARWARGRGRALQIVGVTTAVATLTLSIGLAQVVVTGVARAAELAVGADVRVCGATIGEDVPGVSATAELRGVGGTPVAEDGRLRAVAVFSAPTSALHRVRDDIAELSASGTIVVSQSAAALLRDRVTISGRAVETVAVVPDDTLPVDTAAWLLQDSRDDGGAEATSTCTLLAVAPGTTVSAVATAVREEIPDAEVADTATATATRTAAPTSAALMGLLAAAAAVALVAAAVISTVTAVGARAERRRTREILALLGAPRGRGLVAAEVVPSSIVAALLGWGVGWAGIALVQGAGGLAERLGIGAGPEGAVVGLAAAAAGGTAVIVAVIGTAVAAGDTRRTAARGVVERRRGVTTQGRGVR